jgi:hypothetical protein
MQTTGQVLIGWQGGWLDECMTEEGGVNGSGVGWKYG